MSEHLGNLLCGTFLLALVTLILFNLDELRGWTNSPVSG